MEEKKKVTYKGISTDALVKIEISGTFAARLQALLIFMMQDKSVEEVGKIINDLKVKEPEDEYSFHLLTLLILIQEIEKMASDQGLVKDYEAEENTSSEN
jgi:hypothetical protein